jgi:hypothetical protein
MCCRQVEFVRPWVMLRKMLCAADNPSRFFSPLLFMHLNPFVHRQFGDDKHIKKKKKAESCAFCRFTSQ